MKGEMYMSNLIEINENENSKSSDDSNLQRESILDYELTKEDFYPELTEEDFYPPEDKRIYRSGIADIVGGDNFEDYAKWFYDNYENDLFDN